MKLKYHICNLLIFDIVSNNEDSEIKVKFALWFKCFQMGLLNVDNVLSDDMWKELSDGSDSGIESKFKGCQVS